MQKQLLLSIIIMFKCQAIASKPSTPPHHLSQLQHSWASNVYNTLKPFNSVLHLIGMPPSVLLLPPSAAAKNHHHHHHVTN
jgi:hypothetical protein